MEETCPLTLQSSADSSPRPLSSPASQSGQLGQHGPQQTLWNACLRCWNCVLSREVLVPLCLGQLLSLLLCGTGVTSGLLQLQGVHTPTAQSFLNYVLLALVYGSMLACRHGDRSLPSLLRQHWWHYLLLAAVDVEANYLVVKAYSLTSVTSVQVLDAFTIPVVMVLSAVFLRVRYRVVNFAGALLCVLGLGGLVLADWLVGHPDSSQSGDNPVLGDLLCLLGACLYAISNVGQEFVVKQHSRSEFLGMVGLFGSFISGIQLSILERNEIDINKFSSYKVVLPWLGFVLFLFGLYSSMSLVIQLTSAAAVNLSILSADFYVLLFGLFLFHYQFHVLYLVAFLAILLGVAVYSACPPSTRHNSDTAS